MSEPLDFPEPCVPGDAEWQRRFDLFMADPSPRKWWWLVFQDHGFAGLAIVPGANHVQAISAAWALGCNPGGAVASYPLDVTPNARYVGKLFVDPEAQALADGSVRWWLDDL